MRDHDFCRILLATVRADAKSKHVELPVGMVALGDKHGWFVQGRSYKGKHDDGCEVQGCCAYEAKANRIGKLIDAADATVEQQP